MDVLHDILSFLGHNWLRVEHLSTVMLAMWTTVYCLVLMAFASVRVKAHAAFQTGAFYGLFIGLVCSAVHVTILAENHTRQTAIAGVLVTIVTLATSHFLANDCQHNWREDRVATRRSTIYISYLIIAKVLVFASILILNLSFMITEIDWLSLESDLTASAENAKHISLWLLVACAGAGLDLLVMKLKGFNEIKPAQPVPATPPASSAPSS